MVNTARYVPEFSIKVAAGDDIGSLQSLLGGRPRFDLWSGRTTDVTSVAITETTNQADTFTFSLRSRHAELERFPNGDELLWIDDLSLQPGTLVAVEMGYVGNRALSILGRVKALNSSFTANGTILVRVEGQSLYGDLFRKSLRRPFADKTDSAIIKAMADELGLSTKVRSTSTEHATVTSPDGSLASILLPRAERLYYELTVKGSTLYFEPPRYLEDDAPKLKLIWGEDLLNFSPRINTNGMPTSVEIRNSQTYYGGGSSPIVAKVNAGSVPARLGRRSGPQYVLARFGPNEVLADDQKVTTLEEAKEVATATLRKHAIKFIEGQAATVGNPQLVSRTVIEMQRLGKQFSGRYYVTSTEHTINGSGYQTTFHVNRDGL